MIVATSSEVHESLIEHAIGRLGTVRLIVQYVAIYYCILIHVHSSSYGHQTTDAFSRYWPN